MLREIIKSKGINYMRATYYFGDAAPYTCWDAFRSDALDDYLKRIVADGFNSIIVLIPAAMPEIEIIEPNIAQFFWQSLSRLIERADEIGLFILYRIGYIWDRFPISLDRYALTLKHHLSGDERDRLLNFGSKLYRFSKVYPNFLYGFVTWEDATMYVMDHVPRQPADQRATVAKLIGYNFPFSEIDGQREIIPSHTDWAFGHFLDHVDDMLSKYFFHFKAVFPDLSMEVRCDTYPYPDVNGKTQFHIHNKTFGLEGLDIVGTYYGIYMEANNTSVEMRAEDAFENFLRSQYRVLSCTSHSDRPLVFIDQLLFSMQEEQFAHFPRMNETEQTNFISRCAEWVRRHGIGYASWSFQDYLSDRISNSAFVLGLRGWHYSGAVQMPVEGERGCALTGAGAVIWQLLPEKLPKGFILVELLAEQDSEIEIKHSPSGKCQIRASASAEIQKFLLKFETEAMFLAVELLRGMIRLLKVSIGADIASHGAYTVQGTATPTTSALQNLNRALSEL